MTKTKLQIMREKKGLTIEDVARRAIFHGYTGGNEGHLIYCIYWIESRGAVIKSPRPRKTYEYKYIAQALGCSVDELVEDVG